MGERHGPARLTSHSHGSQPARDPGSRILSLLHARPGGSDKIRLRRSGMSHPRCFIDAMGVDQKIAAIAARQLGVFSRRQAEIAGASKSMIEHRLKARRWKLVRRGVFLLNGSPRSFDQDALSACLAAGEGAVASHDTAARIWGFIESYPSQIEISVPAPRRRRAKGFVVHHVLLSKKDVTHRGVIPITTPFRTLLDLAGTAKKAVTFERAFDGALRNGLITLPKIVSQIADFEGSTVPGLGLMRRTIESRIGLGIPMSDLETIFVNLLDRYRLPQPVRQQRMMDGQRFITTVDFAYRDRKIVIECDGAGSHSSATDLQHDIDNTTDLGLAGNLVLRFSWTDVLWRGKKVCGKIARALGLPFKP